MNITPEKLLDMMTPNIVALAADIDVKASDDLIWHAYCEKPVCANDYTYCTYWHSEDCDPSNQMLEAFALNEIFDIEFDGLAKDSLIIRSVLFSDLTLLSQFKLKGNSSVFVKLTEHWACMYKTTNIDEIDEDIEVIPL